jgi:hypothetical protein
MGAIHENTGGGSGGTALELRRSELAVLGRHIRRKPWAVTDRAKDDVPLMMELIALNSEHERNQIAAAKVLVEMEKANALTERGDDGPTPPLNLNVSINGATVDLRNASVDDLRRLPREELARLYRESLKEAR